MDFNAQIEQFLNDNLTDGVKEYEEGIGGKPFKDYRKPQREDNSPHNVSVRKLTPSFARLQGDPSKVVVNIANARKEWESIKKDVEDIFQVLDGVEKIARAEGGRSKAERKAETSLSGVIASAYAGLKTVGIRDTPTLLKAAKASVEAAGMTWTPVVASLANDLATK